MKTVNALSLRQALGKILDDLDRDKEPIMVEKGRRPRAVLISIDDYQRRFVDHQATEQRRKIAQEILAMRGPAAPGPSVVEELRRLRSGED